MALVSLFFSALLAATLLPMQSELVLSTLIVMGQYAWWQLLLVASIGNILGSVVNWWIGLHVSRYRDAAWFPVKAHQFDKAMLRYRQYGYWSLFLSWLPIIGDPLTVMAGVMKEPLWRFLLCVGLAKLGRYVAVIVLVKDWI